MALDVTRSSAASASGARGSASFGHVVVASPVSSLNQNQQPACHVCTHAFASASAPRTTGGTAGVATPSPPSVVVGQRVHDSRRGEGASRGRAARAEETTAAEAVVAAAAAAGASPR